IAGLRAAAELGARSVEVLMDSKLVVEQMSGRWKIKHPGLRPLAVEAAGLVRGFDSVTFRWIPRAQNSRADALANAAMDAAASGGPAASGGATRGKARAGRASSEPVPLDTEARPRHWTPPSHEATRLILVRHGETALSAERRFSGRGDPELTERGQAQALAAAARVAALLDDGGDARVATSPLRRARRTAEEIVAVLGASEAAGGAAREVVVEPALVECDFGDWEGHSFGEVRDRWPDELDAWLASTAVTPPSGESIDAAAARVLPAVAALREAYQGKTVVVVGHVTGIKAVLRDALDAGPRFLHQLHLDPAGISIVDSWPDGGVSVRLVNDTSHLGGVAT
ncbi:MAG: bifunctional RNase H/acid phosphatase, partial [Micromonosporaceae bacterium]|nr:bifunctional RNase H/acid phosphatase [Micromonosporaceae bacterium]